MSKGIFIAIPILEDLQEEILEWEKDYQRLPVRWLSGKNLHITLVPPWEENDWKETAEKLKSLGGTVGQFGIEFNKVEYGPYGWEPRLIWAEGAAPKEIQNLKTKVENVLGKEPENRPFKLHLTLARFHPKDFVRFPIKKLEEEVFWRQEVKSFVLMESRLLPDGADYEVLGEIMLDKI